MRAVGGRSLRARLARTLVGLGLISVVLLAVVNFVVVRDLLNRGTRDQLTTVRDLRRDTVELGLERLQIRVAALGSDPGVAAALSDLAAGFDALDPDELDSEQLDELEEVYAPIVQRYDDAGADRPTVDELLPTTAAGRYLQYEYLASVPAEERADTDDAGDGSAYSAAHARHHEFLSSLVPSVDAVDVTLLTATGDVVYSSSKLVDFGVGILDGPYRDRAFGRTFVDLGSAAATEAVISDSEFFLPDSAAPVMHVAAYVRRGLETVGAVIVTIRSDVLTEIVTAGGQWDLLGLGDTGDAYVVGADGRLRTTPRSWSNDPGAYVDRYLDIGGDEQTARLMEFTGAPVQLQDVQNGVVDEAIAGEAAIGATKNALDRSVLMAAAPISAGGLGWAVVTEQATSETRSELVRFVVSIALLLAVLLPLLALIGVVLARALARPVQPLVATAGRIAGGDYHTESPDLGRNELGDVGRQLTAVAAELREQEASIEREEERITAMLESILPADLIERVRHGERDLAEVVDTATVVSVALRGVLGLSGGEQDEILELTSRLGATAAEVAAEWGVERIHIANEHQLFVAGRGVEGTRARGAVEFVAALLRSLEQVGVDHGVELRARAGLAAGLVATGVIGTRQTTFGIWGASVDRAAELGARAHDGEVVVDVSVADELDDDWLAGTPEALDGTGGDGGAFLVEVPSQQRELST